MKRALLGFGDRVPAQAANPVARLRYLAAVSRCVPEAIDALVESDQIDAWAQRWGFVDRWAIEAARNHARVWQENPELRGRWLCVAVSAWEPIFPALTAWNPIAETEAAFRARVEGYIADMQAAPGLARTPAKDAGTPHFEWLALHHVAGWTYERIVERYQDADGRPDVPAVSRAVTDTATVIGLTLRAGRGRKLSRAGRRPTQ